MTSRQARTTVVIVEDDERVRNLLRTYLTEQKFHVVTAKDAREAERLLDGLSMPAVMLVDLLLPHGSGLDLVQRARKLHPRIGLIMVSGQSDTIDRVVGLEVGADDYVGKPFHLREVLARINSLVRRLEETSAPSEPASSVFGFDGWEIDLERRSLTGPAGQSLALTAGEFDLLRVFVLNAGRVMDRNRLMDLTRGREWHACDRTIDAQISRLRRRIETDPRHPRIIKSVRAVGYVMSSPVTRLRAR